MHQIYKFAFKKIYDVQNKCVFMLLSAYATHLNTHFSACTNTMQYKRISKIQQKLIYGRHCMDRVSSCNIYAVQQDTQSVFNE